MRSLNILWIVGASINLTMFYINIMQGDYLYAILSALCAIIFTMNIK